MLPPSALAPDNSTCWDWYQPPADGILKSDDSIPPKGCDYKPCEDAVCACDSYCCTTAWDLSCRGYYIKSGDALENNYFVFQDVLRSFFAVNKNQLTLIHLSEEQCLQIKFKA